MTLQQPHVMTHMTACVGCSKHTEISRLTLLTQAIYYETSRLQAVTRLLNLSCAKQKKKARVEKWPWESREVRHMFRLQIFHRHFYTRALFLLHVRQIKIEGLLVRSL